MSTVLPNFRSPLVNKTGHITPEFAIFLEQIWRLLGQGGLNATDSNFLRGDGTYVTPAGGGDVTGAAASTNGELPLYSGATGKLLKRSNSLTGALKVTSGVVSVFTITTFGESLIDDANASAARTTLGLGTLATLNAATVATGGTGATSLTSGELLKGNGAGAVTTVDGSEIPPMWWGGTTAGSGDAFTASISPTPSAYATGMFVVVEADRNSSGGPITLNLNGLGAKSVKDHTGANTSFANGYVYTLVYDGTDFRKIGNY